MELGEAIRRRRSHRHFTGDPMPLAHLGTVLRCAAGVSAMTSVDLVAGGQANLRFRTVASGGGLYPVDLYALCTGVRDLERGLYKYISTRDRIIRVADHEIVPKVLGCFAVPDDVIALSRATVVFLLVGRPWRSMRKYGARGMRFLFMEAGAISQNIHLATQALGFGSVDCASVYDDELHDVLAMDGTFQSLLHTVVVGYQGE
jgi:SagB-type dehydrogenase family enzyme